MVRADELDLPRINTGLAACHILRSLQGIGETDSTNRLLAARAKEGQADTGACLIAECQTDGKGRRGRSWRSLPYQSLTFSFLSPNFFPRQPGWLTLGTALAAAQGIEEETGLVMDVKWPNDLYLEGRKAAGILAEPFSWVGGERVVTGLGLNVNGSPAELDESGLRQPISLEDRLGRPVNRSSLLLAILKKIDFALNQFTAGKTAFLLEPLRKRSLILGSWAAFEWQGKRVEGKVLEHGENLEIRLETAQGTLTLPGETASLIRFSRS